MLLPFVALVAAYLVGVDLSGPLYWVLVGALVRDRRLIWAECLRGARAAAAPAEPPASPPPRATAVIAAYLPNEADTIVETLEAFLRQEYSGGAAGRARLQHPDPDGGRGRAAASWPGSTPTSTVIRVEDSTSKAQNVNAALRVADGEFVGIFDADHHPMDGRLRARLALAGRRRRRGAGPLRDPQRRRHPR